MLYDTTCFLSGVSSLFQHVDLVTTCLRAGFIVYNLVLDFVYVGQGSTIEFAGSWVSFLDSLFFPGSFFGRMDQ